MMTGGVAKNPGVVRAVEEKIQAQALHLPGAGDRGRRRGGPLRPGQNAGVIGRLSSSFRGYGIITTVFKKGMRRKRNGRKKDHTGGGQGPP